MFGAIVGDIVGSRFEWNNLKSKEFDFLTHSCAPTDDSMMTLAVAEALMKTEAAAIDPKEVRKSFAAALEEVRESEAALERILSHAANAGNAEREGDR